MILSTVAMRPLSASLLLGLGAVLGCGGDDASYDPRAQCELLVDALCVKHADCLRQPTHRSRALEDCQFVLKLDWNCKDVREVTTAYSECLTAISRAQCEPSGGIRQPWEC